MIKPIAYVEQPAQRLRVVHGPYVPIPIRVPNLRQFTLSFVFLVEFCPENFLLCFYWFCFLTINTHFNFLSVISKILSYLQKP